VAKVLGAKQKLEFSVIKTRALSDLARLICLLVFRDDFSARSFRHKTGCQP
jgi:hypothetical protein